MKFTKMHGIGNDYIYINLFEEEFDFSNNKKVEEFVKKVSDRNFGIGSDGVIFIDKSNICDAKMRIFNSDGSEAKMCGNGIRCVGKFLYDNKIIKKENITVETVSGKKKLKLYIENDQVSKVKVDMGEIIFEPKKIPVNTNINSVNNLKLKILDKEFVFTCLSVGNPHAVTIVDGLEKFDVNKYGSIIEKHEIFPDKINVEFIEIIDKNNIKMRVYERGSGETLACGTGACASVVALYINNLVNDKVNVNLKGGILQINYDEKIKHVYMTGPATKVFERRNWLKNKTN